MVYENCKKVLEKAPEMPKNEVAWQVVYAKELTPLIEMSEEKFNYPLKRTLYFKKQNKKPCDLGDLKAADSYLNLIFKGQKTNIMGRFLNYIYNKKYEDCDFFVRHFLTRIAVLSKDVNLEHPANKDFYEKLSKCQ